MIKAAATEEGDPALDPTSHPTLFLSAGHLKFSYHFNRSSLNDPSFLLGGSALLCAPRGWVKLFFFFSLKLMSAGVILRIKSWQTFPDISRSALLLVPGP